MVFMKSIARKKTGNTIRPNYFIGCRKSYFHGHSISKTLLYRSNLDEHAIGRIEETFEKYVPDGGLHLSTDLEICETYSLNKRKRWLLPLMIEHAVSEKQVQEDPARLVLLERSVLPKTGILLHPADCVGYHDSKSKQLHSYPNKGTAFFTDLRKQAEVGSNCRRQKAKRKRQFHNQHFRGTQRLHTDGRLHKKNLNSNSETEEYSNHVDVPKPPEVQYEVTIPVPYRAQKHLMPEKHLYVGRQYHFSVRKPKNYRKGKGFRSKPWADEYFLGSDRKEIEREIHCACSGGRNDTSLNTSENTNLDVSAAGWYSSKKGSAYTLNMAEMIGKSLIREQQCKRPKTTKKQKYFRDAVSNDEEKSPNIAMCTQIRTYYGKGKAILSEDNDSNSVFSIDEMRLKQQYDNAFNMTTNASVAMEISQSTRKNDILVDQTDTNNETPRMSSMKFAPEQDPDTKSTLDDTYISLNIFRNDILESKLLRDYNGQIEIGKSVPLRFLVHLTLNLSKHDFSLSTDSTTCRLLCVRDASMLESWCDITENTNHSSLRIAIQDENMTNSDRENVLQAIHDSFKDQGHKAVHLTDVIYAAEKYVTNLYSRNRTMQPQVPRRIQIPSQPDLMSSACGSKVNVYSTEQAFKLVKGNETAKTEAKDEEFVLLDITDGQNTPTCGVCYLTFESDDSMVTTILPCQHCFCNGCWKNYLVERMRRGDMSIECQAYECAELLDDVTIRSLVPHTVFSTWQHNLLNKAVEMAGWKWCPDPNCGHLARVINQDTKHVPAVPVNCACKGSWCFKCYGPSHWPTTCAQAQTYMKMLKQSGDWGDRTVSHTMVSHFVNVKRCPKCLYPMEKDGGCPEMTCTRCRHSFCWNCGKDWETHTYGPLNYSQMPCSYKTKTEMTVQIDRVGALPLTSMYYTTSVFHRKKRRAWTDKKINTVSRELIGREKRERVHKAREHSKAKVKVVLPLDDLRDSRSAANAAAYFYCIKQLHHLLEYYYVMISYSTQKERQKVVRQYLSLLVFLVERMEQVVAYPGKTACVLERLSKLRTIALQKLKTLSRLVPKIQKTISAHQRESRLES